MYSGETEEDETSQRSKFNKNVSAFGLLQLKIYKNLFTNVKNLKSKNK